MDNKINFLKLIENKTIEIPMLQRDYAQGRDDEKTKQIRNTFVNAIYDALSGGKALHLDFVYGTTNNNETFIPLDGQQRLTTLFLLHWYIAIKSDKNNLNTLKINNKSRFTYNTRVSSRDFCDALVNPNVNIAFSDNPLSDDIKNSGWFFLQWMKDPTIKSMLTMLDGIHEKFRKETDIKKFWNNLEKMTFELMDLKDHNLTDKLYIKMNSRGKPLTDWENFKAWFEENCLDKALKEDAAKDWKINIDGKWTDLFWKYKDKNDYLVDQEFMRFFNRIAFNYYLLHKEDQKDEKFDKIYSLFLRENTRENELFVPFETYEKMICFTAENIDKIAKTLDFFHKHLIDKKDTEKYFYFNEKLNLLFRKIETDNKNNIERLFRNIINKDNPTLEERCLLFAFSEFISNPESKPKNLFSYMRIVRNLVLNTKIDKDNIVNILNSIKEIVKLADLPDFLMKASEQLNQQKIIGFNGEQIKEEKEKLEIITGNNKWEEKFNEAENYKFFKGSISSLIDVSRIKEGKHSHDDFDSFEKRFNIYKTISTDNSIEMWNLLVLLQALHIERYRWGAPSGKGYHALDVLRISYSELHKKQQWFQKIWEEVENNENDIIEKLKNKCLDCLHNDSYENHKYYRVWLAYEISCLKNSKKLEENWGISFRYDQIKIYANSENKIFPEIEKFSYGNLLPFNTWSGVSYFRYVYPKIKEAWDANNESIEKSPQEQESIIEEREKEIRNNLKEYFDFDLV